MGREEIVDAGWGTNRQFILSTLAELGDLQYQRATWLDPEMQNPHYSYVEFVECFYESCGGDWRVQEKDAPNAPFKLCLKDNVITPLERDLLWEVHIALLADNPPDDYDHVAILGSTSWQIVVNTASSAVAELKQILTDPADLDALTNELPSVAAKRWP